AGRFDGDRDVALSRRCADAASLQPEPGAVGEKLPHRYFGALADLDEPVAPDFQPRRRADGRSHGIVEPERERRPRGFPVTRRAVTSLHLAGGDGELDGRNGWRDDDGCWRRLRGSHHWLRGRFFAAKSAS